MKALLRLYPRAWRARYGEEFAELLASERPTPRFVFDVLAGALDARLNPQLGHHLAAAQNPARARTAREGIAMIGELEFRCRTPAGITRRQAWLQAFAFLGMTLGLSVLYGLAKSAYGPLLWVEAFGMAIFPLCIGTWTIVVLARRRSLAFKVLLFAAITAISLLGAWLDSIT
jgi:hypothetical protein